MKFNALKKAINSVLKVKSREKIAVPDKNNGARTKPFVPSAICLPPSCEGKAFPLLDLPPELVEVIIAEMVAALGPYRAVRLRFVNSRCSMNEREDTAAKSPRIIQ